MSTMSLFETKYSKKRKKRKTVFEIDWKTKEKSLDKWTMK